MSGTPPKAQWRLTPTAPGAQTDPNFSLFHGPSTTPMFQVTEAGEVRINGTVTICDANEKPGLEIKDQKIIAHHTLDAKTRIENPGITADDAGTTIKIKLTAPTMASDANGVAVAKQFTAPSFKAVDAGVHVWTSFVAPSIKSDNQRFTIRDSQDSILFEAKSSGIDIHKKTDLHADGDIHGDLKVRKGATVDSNVTAKSFAHSTGGYLYIRNANPGTRTADHWLWGDDYGTGVKLSPNKGFCERWAFELESTRDSKENIHQISVGVATAALMALNPVTYDYIDSKAWRPNVGFIAEEMPDMLRSHDRKSISLFEVTPVLTRVLQRHEMVIADLEAKIAVLTKQLAALQAGPVATAGSGQPVETAIG